MQIDWVEQEYTITAMAKKKAMNIDDVARLVQHGFTEIDGQFKHMDGRFDRIEQRLERIERIVIADHERRLKRLEVDIDYLKDALAIK